MNLNIVIRKNYSEWFDIDVKAEEVLGVNYKESDGWDDFKLIQDYVTKTYGEHHDVKMWELGRPKKVKKNFIIQIDEYTYTISDEELIGKVAHPRNDYKDVVETYVEMIAGDNFDNIGRISYILVDREDNEDEFDFDDF